MPEVSDPVPPKKKRWWWYLQVPFCGLMFVLWFGVDTLLLRNIPLLLMLVFVLGTLHLINKGFDRWFDPPLKPRTWRAAKLCLLQMTAWLAFVFAVLCVMRFCLPPVAISKRTTHLTTPLTADGREIDLAKAIDERFNPKGTPEDNGFRHVVRLFGPEQVFDIVPDHREEYTLHFLKQLELSDEPAKLKYRDIYAFFKENLESNLKDIPAKEKNADAVWSLVGEMLKKPWKTDDFEGSGDWLRDNAEALDKFGEAVRMPTYYVPLFLPPKNEWDLSGYCFEGKFHRSIVRALQCRVMNSLGEGDFEKVVYDTESILRFTNLMIERPVSTTQYLIARAAQGVGFLTVRRILEFGNPTKEQIESLREIVQNNQASIDLADLVFLFRIEGMHWLYSSANGRIFTDNRFITDRYSAIERQLGAFVLAGMRYFGWNPVFARFQENFDQLGALINSPISYSQYRAIVDWQETTGPKMIPLSAQNLAYYFLFRKGLYSLWPEMGGWTVYHIMADIAVPGIFSPHYRGVVQLRQTELALALELFRLDRGRYPPSLDALLGDYLDSLPSDPFTDGELFRYSLLEPDGWSLYSVGPNGIDDDGFNKSEKCGDETPNEKNKNGDDIRIRRIRE